MFPFQTLDLCLPAKTQDTGWSRREGVEEIDVVRVERVRTGRRERMANIGFR